MASSRYPKMVKRYKVHGQQNGFTCLCLRSTVWVGWTMMKTVAKRLAYAGPNRDQCLGSSHARLDQHKKSVCWVRFVNIASSSANVSVCDSISVV
mmetsp:Transcript_40700/g.115513  ORF Transcript_40700/g.115513 Transcript_40700/m.115513 type:complete len:95 (+) Transcript_40700:125-409(+)